MKFKIGALIVTASLTVLGCDQPMEAEGGSGVQTTQEALISGAVTGIRPEIGFLVAPDGSSCTATLVARRWVLTAAHCVDFLSIPPLGAPGSAGVDPSRFVFFPANGTGISSTGFPAMSVLNLGPPGPAPTDIYAETSWLGSHATKATDGSGGNNDIALILLKAPVPSSLVPTPATLASSLPPVGGMATDFGYGCTDQATQATDNLKRFASWIMQAPDFNGGLPTGGHICSGDSGGPVVNGSVNANGAVWGVNSIGSGPVIGLDTFGSVAFFQRSICQPMQTGFQWWIGWGVPGIPVARGCPEQGPGNSDDVVRYVCDAMPSCCMATWTTTCASLGTTVANFTPPPTTSCRRGRCAF